MLITTCRVSYAGPCRLFAQSFNHVFSSVAAHCRKFHLCSYIVTKYFSTFASPCIFICCNFLLVFSSVASRCVTLYLGTSQRHPMFSSRRHPIFSSQRHPVFSSQRHPVFSSQRHPVFSSQRHPMFSSRRHADVSEWAIGGPDDDNLAPSIFLRLMRRKTLQIFFKFFPLNFSRFSWTAFFAFSADVGFTETWTGKKWKSWIFVATTFESGKACTAGRPKFRPNIRLVDRCCQIFLDTKYEGKYEVKLPQH
jgi:hypothetical protein